MVSWLASTVALRARRTKTFWVISSARPVSPTWRKAVAKTRSTCRLTKARNAASDPSRAYDLTRSRSVGMATVFISYQDCRSPSKPNTVRGRSKPARDGRMKTCHFEVSVALGPSGAATQRDEPTRRESATFQHQVLVFQLSRRLGLSDQQIHTPTSID